MARAIYDHMRPTPATPAELAKLVAANPKGWYMRSRLSTPEVLYIVAALDKSNILADLDAPPTEHERRLWGRMRQAFIDDRRFTETTVAESERPRVYAALAQMGGRAAVTAKCKWANPPDLTMDFVRGYRNAVKQGI